MITADGWLDWAIRTPGPMRKVNKDTNGTPLFNTAQGIFLHSAEGYKDNLLDLAVNGPLSWHLSNCIDGELHQHYPLTVQTWHASAANPRYIGMEDEGVGDIKLGRPDPTLYPLQIDNAVRVIKELSEWRRWTPKRPVSATDTTHTLWEHTEVPRIGGSGTACPSGRIPWDTILARLAVPPPAPEPERRFIAGDAGGGLEVAGHQLIVWNEGIAVLAIGDFEGEAPGQIAKLFGSEWRWLRQGAPIVPLTDDIKEAVWSTAKGD